MVEPRQKLRLINYADDFVYGRRVPVFIVGMSGPSPATDVIGAELNPHFRAIIAPTRVSDERRAALESGQMVIGRVVGVNKTKRTRVVEVSLMEPEEEEEAKQVGVKLLDRCRFRDQ